MNTWVQKIHIGFCLLCHGIRVNLTNGQISYLPYVPSCKCKRLRLLRHGKTIAVLNNEFMSNSSDNSALSKEGIAEIVEISHEIRNNIPDIVLVATINRAIETYNILQSQIEATLPTEYCSYILGINNSVWAGKSIEMLSDEDLRVFMQRECAHNIFAKTVCGDSWGDVLVRCAKLIHKINKQYVDKDILLVSQGSIYQGLKILLHRCKSPWEDYSAKTMFGISHSCKETVGYGRIFNIL